MNVEPTPVSDHARRTARRVATLLTEADALLITAGSGLSAECTAPDDAELQQCQASFVAQARGFRAMAQPYRFEEQPELAWGWYGHRQLWYRHLQPHDGYRILRAWAQALPHGCFVATTNIDGQFFAAGFTDWQVLERHGSVFRYQCTQPCCDDVWSAPEPGLTIDPETLRATGELPRCPHCGALARPNVLMYDDTRWLDAVRREQQRRFDAWLASVRGKRLVVIELGAGEGAASVRRLGDRMLERSRVSLVRINPTATEADEPLQVLRLPALAAIRLIHESLPDRFGGSRAATPLPPQRAIDPVTSPIRLSVGRVTGVDLGRGLVTALDICKLGKDEDFAFLERYGEAQSGWVQVPPCNGLEAPGYTMTARALRSPDDHEASTPGAVIVFVQAPDEQAVATFGIGRRMADGGTLWAILYSTTDRPLAALDCPAMPWVAFRPARGLDQHGEVMTYLAEFGIVLARSYLTYLAFIDATRRR
jgi:NAD-dependent SIR2 family protein deacetylase